MAALALLDRAMRSFVQTGRLRIIDAHGGMHVYEGAPGRAVTVRLTDPMLHRALVLNPELRTGEAYMNGTLLIEEGTLRDLLMLYAENRAHLRGQPAQRALRKFYKGLRSYFQRNPLARSRANVAHHYDLSNELYALFLDDGLNYSCAYFRDRRRLAGGRAAEEASHRGQAAARPRPARARHRLGLGRHGDLSGRGGGVDVTGVTLSVEQHALATERARQRGLSDRVRFELKDYRHVTGRFDRIVSVGMFEHVGIGHFDEFFDKVASLLADDGVALLHAIGRKGGPGVTAAWVRKYIFPGGYSPALSETLAAIERAGLWVTDIEVLRLHYALTLREWERRFQSNRARIAELLDERFCRMWEFHLIVSELSFTHGKHMNFQI